jgi:hypothetical protein
MTMRTTIFLNNQLGRRLQAAARRQGKTLSAFLAEAGRRCLTESPAPAPPFTLITRGGSGIRPGVDLDQASALLATEDRETYRARPR